MGQIVLSRAGAAAGAQLLPGGVSLLGRQLSGAGLGRFLGSVAGQAIDAALFSPRREGPRLTTLHLTESREGAGMPSVYGRMRIGGQVIWAARFQEHRRKSGGGKGGPRLTEFTYSLSFAVAICEGEISGVERIWANGEPLPLGDITHRIYRGDEEQQPDPLIEAVEGPGNVPGYRGTAYIVFEDLPLERFANRLPQLSFEVVRVPPGGESGALTASVKAVNIIPASGEFVYATEIVRTREFPGRESAINANTADGRADFEVSLDQLVRELPLVSSAALTVGWFGDDLRAEHCRVRPGVETRDKQTVPWSWRAGDVGRGDAWLVSGAAQGAPNFGGTPADAAVVQGIAVTMSPFLFIDVPDGNTLPDPHGGQAQAPFPWRGRITSPTDGSAGADGAVAAFMGSAVPSDFSVSGTAVSYHGNIADWGYRRFILHLAHLALAAGGVDSFLIGSELRGLTRLRDASGGYPFVAQLIALAADVRAVLGPGVAISYAADWSEYGAHLPGDGSGDVRFPLDPLWAHPAIDFVGIDWYPPAGDWRDGQDHLDALAGFRGADERAYLEAQFAGGQDYDWFYADATDRDNQIRTPINDTAHGEHWVFRAKDVSSWWANAHHERPGGVRSTTPTGWLPEMKPVRFSEIGFPAVDKGGNSPNLFFDPKSSESALPPYSSGARDDVFLSRALSAALAYFDALPAVEEALVWAWDARPFPTWPGRDDLWSDGGNWMLGHWLNGRTGLVRLADAVADLCRRAGLEAWTSARVNGLLEGYTIDGVHSLRAALEPLVTAFALEAFEADGQIVFQTADAADRIALDRTLLAGDGPLTQYKLLDKPVGHLLVSYADPSADHQPATAQARDEAGDPRNRLFVDLPMAMSPAMAERIAGRLLGETVGARAMAIDAGLSMLAVTPGDRLSDGDLNWRVVSCEEGETLSFDLVRETAGWLAPRAIDPPGAGQAVVLPAVPEWRVIDAPVLTGGSDPRPLVAAAGEPWPGEMALFAGSDAQSLSERARIVRPAVIGRLLAPLSPGPVGRWDRHARLDIEVSEAVLSSAGRLAVLAGVNAMLVETPSGWELIGFREAELTGPRHYRLSALLRGLQGSDSAAAAGAGVGAACVLLDEAVVRADIDSAEIGLPLLWRLEGDLDAREQVFTNLQARPWPVGQLAYQRNGDALSLRWMARGVAYAEGWNLPDPEISHSFEVQWLLSGTYSASFRVETSQLGVPAGAQGARVREVDIDGRFGEWVTIGAANV